MAGTRPFTILHQDPHIVVVDKSAGLLTVPTARGERNTLVQLLRRHLGRGRPDAPRLAVVHRLDRGVSGVLVFARSPEAAGRLRAAFAAHWPDREYLALVAGDLAAGEGTFSSRLVTGKGLRRRSTRRTDIGEEAVTHYQVERRLGSATLVRVRLETGRRNQIRVHFAEAGHPVLGEERYRPELARHRAWTWPRLALHAHRLAFRHPITGQVLRFESPAPAAFSVFVRRAAHAPAGPPPPAPPPSRREDGPLPRPAPGDRGQSLPRLGRRKPGRSGGGRGRKP